MCIRDSVYAIAPGGGLHIAAVQFEAALHVQAVAFAEDAQRSALQPQAARAHAMPGLADHCQRDVYKRQI